jgi:SAM-dependent methyltransferase
MLKYAKNYCSELNNIIFLQVDGQRLPLPDSSFDWAVARESLCYVPDLNLAQILAEFHRILKPGGRLLLLDQFSDNPYWQNHPGAPNMIKRAPQFILEEVHKAGFIVEVESKVRSPRFIWIYALQFGLLPRWTIPYLARWEVAWHVRFPHKSFRWWNELFVLRRAGDE